MKQRRMRNAAGASKTLPQKETEACHTNITVKNPTKTPTMKPM